MAESKHSPGNRGHYTVYSPEQKAEIARYAAEHGNLKAVCEKFSEEFGIEVKESTARQFKKAYFVQLNAGKDPDQITSLRGKKRGRPSKVGLYQQSAPSPSPSLGPTSFAFGVTPSPASVVVAEINGVAGEYDQMVGEMAISTCITDLMNGDTVAKPLVLVAYCSDGKMETQELSSVADVRAYPEVYDLSFIPEDVCSLTAYAIVGMKCPFDQRFIDRCPKLKIVVVLGSSFDNVDIDHAGRLGVVVCNTPDLCIEEVADSAFSFILSFYRQTAFLHQAVQAGMHLVKQEDIFAGAKAARRIRGRTLGLLGLGKTGIALTQRAKAFGFNVIFYDPSTAVGLEKAIGGLERVSHIADLLTRSDCLSLHCSLSEESRHIINEDTLQLFKRGAFLVNVTHSLLVDEIALHKVLRSGKLGGAALDVCGDPSFRDGAMKGCPNLIHTPHVSWYSRESFSEVRGAAIRLVHLALTSVDGLSMHNCVNASQLDVDLCRLRWSPSS